MSTGAIQLSRDERLIDFSSIRKDRAERKTIALLFERASNWRAIADAMDELATPERPVATRFAGSTASRIWRGWRTCSKSTGAGVLRKAMLRWRRASNLPIVKVTGIDYAVSMLGGAKKWFANEPQVHAQHADAAQLRSRQYLRYRKHRQLTLLFFYRRRSTARHRTDFEAR